MSKVTHIVAEPTATENTFIAHRQPNHTPRRKRNTSISNQWETGIDQRSYPDEMDMGGEADFTDVIKSQAPNNIAESFGHAMVVKLLRKAPELNPRRKFGKDSLINPWIGTPVVHSKQGVVDRPGSLANSEFTVHRISETNKSEASILVLGLKVVTQSPSSMKAGVKPSHPDSMQINKDTDSSSCSEG